MPRVLWGLSTLVGGNKNYPLPFVTSRGCSAYSYLVVHYLFSLVFSHRCPDSHSATVSRGFLYRSLEISLCSSLLSSTLPCKFCISFFPLILYSIFSTQGYSCTILVSPLCALFWKFSLESQLWYLWGTLHLFSFPWESSILYYRFSNIWKMLLHIFCLVF